MHNNILLLTIGLLCSLQHAAAISNYRSLAYEDFEPELSSCEKLHHNLQQALSAHKNIDANRTQQINIYRRLTNRLRNNITELQRKVNEHQSTIINRTEELKHTQKLFHVQDKILCDVNKTLIETSENLSTSETNLLKLSIELQQIKLELSETREKAANQTLTIAAMNTTITQQNVTINLYKEQYDMDRKQLKTNRALITEFESNVTAMSQQIVEFKSELNSKSERIKHLESLIDGYSNCCQASSCVPFGNSSNVHVIKVEGYGEPFKVLCNSQLEAAGAGWTVIQRRIDGSVNFYRNWSEYQAGFGDLTGEFFIGLDKLHAMTTATPHELFIHLEDFDNKAHYARYDDFQIGTEQEGYALKLGNYAGDVENAMRLNKDQKFSTHDRDNDKDESRNCAESKYGAWWYNKCGFSNLNGLYQIADSNYDTGHQGIFWDDEDNMDGGHGMQYSRKSVIMMIRPKQSIK